MNRRILYALSISLVAFMMLAMWGCTKADYRSGSTLLIVKLKAIQFLGLDDEGDPYFGEMDVLKSDVYTNGGVTDDDGRAYLAVFPKNPNIVPDYYMDVRINKVDVSFAAANGPTIEGLTVPYSFSQGVSAYCRCLEADDDANAAATRLDFVVISWDAKDESPLRELRYNGELLQFFADIKVWGRDMAGYDVEPPQARLTVWCANFADPGGD